MKKINYDYLRLYQEMPLLLGAAMWRKNKSVKRTGRILVVNPCIIGDFMASLPALRQFIERRKSYAIDIVVSPPLKNLAQRIKGIKNVFVAPSIYSRNNESASYQKQDLGVYDEIVIMRISRATYKLISKAHARIVKSSFTPYFKYALHLAKNVITNGDNKQWVEVNFEMLRQRKCKVMFEDMFKFTKEDYKRVNSLHMLDKKNKIVILHTSAPWAMKRWDNNKWAELIKRINATGKFRFVFVGSTKEEEKDYLKIQRDVPFKLYSLIKKVDLRDLILIMKKSDYFIGIDSGPRNMANLAGLRNVTMIGSGVNLFKPTNDKGIVIDKSKGGSLYQLLFYTKKNNMNKIEVDEVYSAFDKLTKNRKRKE